MAIVTSPELLRQPCEPVRNRAEGGRIARKLMADLERHNNYAWKFNGRDLVRKGEVEALPVGIGLSAPQIGVYKQVFVLAFKGYVLSVMNPVLVEHSADTVRYEEGCLSLPGQRGLVERWAWVELDTLNQGRLRLGGTSGADLLAGVAAQHELDHLQGILFTDRLVVGDRLEALVVAKL